MNGYAIPAGGRQAQGFPEGLPLSSVLLDDVEQQEILCRGKAEPTVGKVVGKDFLCLGCRVDRDKFLSLHAFAGIVKTVAAGHPAIMMVVAFH